MSTPDFNLANAPIVEAVLDIDCDMPPGFDLAAMEDAAVRAYRPQYPKLQKQLLQEHKIETKPGAVPAMSVRNVGLQSLQLRQEDDKQLVQVRVPGFSFNRLAPYTSLDDYLPEIERTWRIFVGLTAPVQVRTVRLRYVNRILLPLTDGKVKLDDYLRVGPRLPDEENLTFAGFLNQHAAVENATGHQINIVLTSQAPAGDKLPIIFDNCVAGRGPADPQDWPWILAKVLALRSLKNRIFENTLTPQCLSLFQR
ncbi:MAG: TIGR04255 family protein [Opitutaceae bacterium]